MCNETQRPRHIFSLLRAHEFGEFFDWPTARPDIVFGDVGVMELAQRNVDGFQSGAAVEADLIDPYFERLESRLTRGLACAQLIWLGEDRRFQAEAVVSIEDGVALGADLFASFCQRQRMLFSNTCIDAWLAIFVKYIDLVLQLQG